MTSQPQQIFSFVIIFGVSVGIVESAHEFFSHFRSLLALRIKISLYICRSGMLLALDESKITVFKRFSVGTFKKSFILGVHNERKESLYIDGMRLFQNIESLHLTKHDGSFSTSFLMISVLQKTNFKFYIQPFNYSLYAVQKGRNDI